MSIKNGEFFDIIFQNYQLDCKAKLKFLNNKEKIQPLKISDQKS